MRLQYGGVFRSRRPRAVFSADVELPGAQWAQLRDEVEVVVGVDNAYVMVERGDGDEQVRDWPSVQEAAMMSEVSLEVLG